MSMKMRRGTRILNGVIDSFKNQEELFEFFGYEMIEDLNADTVYARRVETFTDEYEKELMKFCDAGNQIKVMGAN